MAPGQKKRPTTDESLTEYEKERAHTMMMNNQVLRSLGVTQLASILHRSLNAKSKCVARADSDSLYEPADDDEDDEHGVVDKISETSKINKPTGGKRGSKRVFAGPVQQDKPARVTRQRMREQSSIEEGTNGTSMNEEHIAVDAALATPTPAQVDEMEEMDHEGSRCYIAQTYVVKKKDIYKDVAPTAIDLFRDLHCSSKTGISEPVREALEQMEAIMAEPTDDGQDPKTPAEVGTQVLPSSKFLQNIGYETRGPKKTTSTAARVQELEAEIQAERQDGAALRSQIEYQRN